MAADRVTRVSLTANVSNYITGMNQAAAATRATGTAAERLAAQRQSFDSLGKGLVSIGAVATAAVAISVKKFAEFDAAVSQIQAATHATAGAMGDLRAAAIDAGAKTVFSATEAANAITELAKAGVSTKDILGGGLNGALSLASAGELGVADAASIAATAMTQFGLSGAQVPHIADLLAAGAGKAQGSVSDLAAALNQGGLVASQAGFSIEETTGTLAAFASAGLLGSDAGTSLKTAILALESPSTTAAAAMKEYGINVYDANGNIDSFSEIAGTLQKKLGGLTSEQRNAALATIFGNDAVRAANVLYSDGADGIADWTSRVNDTNYAAETARINLDNLKGDLEQLGGAFDTALIQTGSGANGSLRKLTQSATYLVGEVGQMPQPLLAAALATGTLTAATALTGGAALIAIPKFGQFKLALSRAEISLRSAALRTVGAGVAIGGLGLAIGALVSYQAEFKAGTAELTDTLDKSTGSITKYTRSTVAKALADKGVFAAAKEAGVSQRELTDAVIEGGDAVDRIKEKFGKTNTFGGVFTGVSERSGVAQLNLSRLSDQVSQSKVDFKDLQKSGEDAAEGTGQVGETSAVATAKLAELSGAADTGATSLDDLKNAIEGFGSAQLDVDSATRDFQSAIDDMTSAVDKNGSALNKQKTNFDVGSEAGRANQAALEDIASSTLKLSSATLTQTNDSAKAAAVILQGREAFLKAAEGAGISQAAARKYADQLGLIPKNVSTAVNATGVSTATQAIANLRTELDRVPRSLTTVLNVQRKESNTIAPYTPAAAAALGIKNKKAVGGPISGPGTSTSDSVPALLSDGEFVVKASSVQKYGLGTLAALNAGSLPRFAVGGPVAVGAAKRKLDDAEAAQKRSQADYDRIKSAAAKGRLETAKARTAAAERALKAAQDAPTGASSSDRISFRSTVRAGEFDSEQGVRSLYSMGNDASAYSSKARRAFIDQANRSEVRMLKLEKASDKAGKAVEKAADTLGDLKDKSASLASSVASNLSGQGVSDFGSASSFARGQSRTAATLKQLAPVLDKLRKKGLSPALIAQIAGLAPVEALRMAKSFDALSGAGIKSVNADYKSVQSTSAAIGKQVADANYGAQIKAAQTALTDARKNAKTITTELKTQGLLLRKVVGKGLGLKGYMAGGYTGAGAVNQMAGIVHAGEFVTNARATANPRNRMMLEAMNRDGYPGYAAGGYARPVYTRGGSSGGGIDVPTLVAALKQIPRDVTQNNEFKPVHDIDGPTMATVLGRELNREFAGMNR